MHQTPVLNKVRAVQGHANGGGRIVRCQTIQSSG
jgi:hypothetical protein